MEQPDMELLMSEPSLPELESQRAGLFARLATLGDFRRGSISENYRRCGKPNCACAQPGHRGHGPRWLWTRTVAGRGTGGRQLSPGEVDKVRGELGQYQEFAALTEQIVEVSEAICEARPVSPQAGRAGGAGVKATARADPGRVRGRGGAAGRGGRQVAGRGRRGRAGGGGAGDPAGGNQGGRFAAGGLAGR
jgi:hypothetical protein